VPNQPIPPNGATLECDVLLIRGVYAPAAPLDPIVDSTTPPEDWHMNQVVARKTITFALSPPVGSPSASPAP
jgi:hypothetical protein